MWCVPVKGDLITTSDDIQVVVEGYSNYKSKGPVVYCTAEGSSTKIPVYFFDIKELNGVKIEFSNTSKVLNALGLLKRKQHLPQKKDTIFVMEENDEGNEVEKKVKVAELKLHNRNIGLSRGLLVIGEDEEFYSLADIKRIKRTSGDSYFDENKFQKLYQDYLGYREKRK
jgi:hypothetical protein